MGVKLSDLVERKDLKWEQLEGKKLAIDASNVLFQFTSSIRQSDGTPLMDNQKRITSHLSGIFYRNVSLLQEGIKLVYVFDGVAPSLKEKTYKKRKEVRDIAEEKYEHAKDEEDLVAMKRYSSQLLRLDNEMIR